MAELRDPEKYPYASVEQTDREVPPPTAEAYKKRQFWEKLSIYNIGVLVIGTGVIFVALAFLAFFWICSHRAIDGKSFTRVWWAIVTYKWTSRVVTLSTVLIRIAAAAQLGVFAAIMAALILERVGASAEDFPLLSMIRCSNTGPQSLMWNVIHTIPTGSQFGYSILIVLALLNALTLQFASTILLADFGDATVVMGRNESSIHFGLIEIKKNGPSVNTDTGIDFWKQGPTTYPSFAEWREDGLKGSNFVDTGKTYRGLIPFRATQERKTLHSYEGPLTIVDTRVVCVKPEFSNLSVDPNATVTGSVLGVLSFKNTHPAISEGWNEGYTFNCSLPMRDFNNPNNWALSLCSFGQHVGRLSDGIYEDNERSLSTGHTIAQLWLNTTMVEAGEDDFYPTLTSLEQMESSSTAWSRFGNELATFDASLCFINPLPADYQGKISAEYLTEDVYLQYTPDTSTYNTEAIRRLYGATSTVLPYHDRGIFYLDPVTNWTENRIDSLYNISSYAFLVNALSRSDQGDDNQLAGLSLSMATFSTGVDSVHRNHLQVVQRIMQTTRNPALALQAISTIILQMSYYDFMPEYDATAPGSWEPWSTVNIPTRWRAFGAIIGLLFLHFALLTLALVLFFKRTQMSLLGNSWQAVSQVMSSDTAHAVHHGAMATDWEMRREVKKSAIAKGRIVIAKSQASGRTEAVSVAKRR
ncbi:hypothetical protein IQ07DRAFT_115170 [Pyrenochaeta sp. DS3sAY3a]|nr:hypothetical protein IQ07DRAFT_115170 [Pyrenochaeta sp. DS3sAY3a]